MDTTPLDLSHLFAQLGLDGQPERVDAFIRQHKLGRHERLEEAPFWNESQRAFLREERARDAEWSETIDVLDTLLRN
ncbi:DUF2789 domain-containing protein [Ferrimonas balearica]|uniref:DUF2789 domain-containing protein n=1 Tax=Ferrimonas balearica TaxID=44012 RepID=UPI001C97E18C|nr:DUF2789 domain-containing protein [Ferrimonas balearica]MBY5978812.1 DUF2789 domain-containing protein [Ferrimonas balearica]